MTDTPAKLTILVADDDAQERNLLFDLLSNNYEVLLAADGLDAMRLFEANRERIVAVITDVQMPRLSGAELVEWLHGRKPQLPVILLSGNFGDVEISCVFQKQNAKWLPKPFEAEQLKATLKRLVESASSGGK